VLEHGLLPALVEKERKRAGNQPEAMQNETESTSLGADVGEQCLTGGGGPVPPRTEPNLGPTQKKKLRNQIFLIPGPRNGRGDRI